jgi:hypothetical protein
LLEQLPSLAEIFKPSRAVIPFVHSPQLSFRSGTAAGPRWAMLPSAAGFVDPLLSTGFPLTLLGVKRIAGLLNSHWHRPSFRPQLKDYAQLTLLELDTAAQLVGALYATMNRFDLFRELSLLYFAAASFLKLPGAWENFIWRICFCCAHIRSSRISSASFANRPGGRRQAGRLPACDGKFARRLNLLT